MCVCVCVRGQYGLILTLNVSCFSRKCMYFGGGRGIGGNKVLIIDTLKHTHTHTF